MRQVTVAVIHEHNTSSPKLGEVTLGKIWNYGGHGYYTSYSRDMRGELSLQGRKIIGQNCHNSYPHLDGDLETAG